MSVRKGKRQPKTPKAVIVATPIETVESLIAQYRAQLETAFAINDRAQAHPGFKAWQKKNAEVSAALETQKKQQEAAEARAKRNLYVSVRNVLEYRCSLPGGEGSLDEVSTLHAATCMLHYFNSCGNPENQLTDDDEFGRYLIIQQAVEAMRGVQREPETSR